jgi:hypothetical protein
MPCNQDAALAVRVSADVYVKVPDHQLLPVGVQSGRGGKAAHRYCSQAPPCPPRFRPWSLRTQPPAWIRLDVVAARNLLHSETDQSSNVVVVVDTADELRQALKLGGKKIVLHSHLDLRGLPAAEIEGALVLIAYEQTIFLQVRTQHHSSALLSMLFRNGIQKKLACTCHLWVRDEGIHRKEFNPQMPRIPARD